MTACIQVPTVLAISQGEMQAMGSPRPRSSYQAYLFRSCSGTDFYRSPGLPRDLGAQSSSLSYEEIPVLLSSNSFNLRWAALTSRLMPAAMSGPARRENPLGCNSILLVTLVPSGEDSRR